MQLKTRVSNISGLKKYLKSTSGMIKDVTDKSTIGTKFCYLNYKDTVTVDDLVTTKTNTKLVLLTDSYIIVVTRDADDNVTSCEAVQNNRNNHELIHKYINQGHLDHYDEFEKVY